MRYAARFALCASIAFLAACSGPAAREQPTVTKKELQSYFKPDPATAGVLTGTVRFTGRKPVLKRIDMTGDPACVEAHHGKAVEETVVVNPNGTLANTFVYISAGMEGRKFEPPPVPVTIDQQGCGFHPRVLGIQTGQTLQVTNSDPVTHNIHPLAQVNREWNHSQGQGDAPLARKFVRQEIMIRVKCNIHSWMHAYIGAVDHPYFAVTGAEGSFTIPNLPPGDYTLTAWQEELGVQEQKVTITPAGKIETSFTFKGK